MVHVAPTGFTCLYSGGSNPQADIIFVHGLGGHPQGTWSAKQPEPDASTATQGRVRKRDRLFNTRRSFLRLAKKSTGPEDASTSLDPALVSREQLQSGQDVIIDGGPSPNSAGKVFWPQDLLPQNFADVRVMTYGYHSDPRKSFQDNLYTLSKGLLTELANERITAPNRPIIFIAHSLGGILIKKALDQSQRSTGAEAALKCIRGATRGVIFFGTPHSGSDMASWAEILRRVLGVFTVTNRNLLAILDSQHDNGLLEELRVDFAKMLGPAEQKKFQVVNFRETQPLFNGPVGPAANLVVSLASASIESEWASNSTLAGNHRTICKFSGCEDEKYRIFRAALDRLLETIDGKDEEHNEEHISWLQKLHTCLYEDRKDSLNPPPVRGTCEWFMNHTLYKDWKQADKASLLWVSADPGGGKSVLARYLIDVLLPSNKKRTTCYFFFKDGFLDQTSVTDALCCILHQIFKKRPGSFSTEILRKFKEDGDKLLQSFSGLWDMLVSLATHDKDREIVCVIDALDECSEPGQGRLIKAIVDLYSKVTEKTPVLKFLVTSRPYQDIKIGFHSLGRKIHLSGESEEEMDKISREIDLVIRHKAEEISSRRQLSQDEHSILIEELTRNPNRTYLWVHLILAEVDVILLTSRQIRSKIRRIPKTVDEAYSRILSRSRDVVLAQRLLHIVLAAKRPLTLKEMALALALGPEHKSHDSIEPVPEDRFRNDVRELCGLFVTVVDKKIYLLHQTAREFLVPLEPNGHLRSPSLSWKSTFLPGESNRILAEICLWRLRLADFSLDSVQSSIKEGRPEVDKYVATRTLLEFAARYWAGHFRKGEVRSGDSMIEMAVDCCSGQMPASLAWLHIYRAVTLLPGPNRFTPLMVAACFGLSEVMERLIAETVITVDEVEDGMTALHLAASSGSVAVVQQLLAAGASVHLEDKYGQTALHWTARGGHETVIQPLLAAGANIDAQDNHGQTALHITASNDYVAVIQQLLAAGANVHLKDRDGRTALHKAIRWGYGTTQQLLAAGADVHARDDAGQTALHWVALKGDEAITRQLLAAGANVHARDNDGQTALHWAALNRDRATTGQLLVAGADVHARDDAGQTALHWAALSIDGATTQQLLAAGANVHAWDNDGRTALQIAVEHDKEAFIQQCLIAEGNL